MALKHGTAGKSTRDMEKKRYIARVIMVAIGLLSMALLYLILSSMLPKNKGLSGVISVVATIIAMKIIANTTLKEAKEVERLERRASRGAEAEEKVDGLLKKLPNDYAVFNDVESPYGNIDHVVINTNNAIFLLETKAHGGTVSYNESSLLVNGKVPEKDFISQTLKNTFWLRDYLKEQTGVELYVKPIIVFTNAFVKVHKPIKGVSVINKKYLLDSILKPIDFKTTSDTLKMTPHLALLRLKKKGEET